MIERDYRESAEKSKEAGRIAQAADFYISSAFGYLMKFRRSDGTSTKLSPTKFGYFNYMLFNGILCHRIVGNQKRARKYSEVGVTIVSDTKEYEELYNNTDHAPEGFFHECIGDFLVAAGDDSYRSSYEKAAEYYRPVENPIQWSAEPEFELQVMKLLRLAEDVDYEIDTETKGQIQHRSLDERIQFKQNHFAAILEEVIEAESG